MGEALIYLTIAISLLGFMIYCIAMANNHKIETLMSTLTHEYGLPIPKGINIVARGLGGESKDNINFIYQKDKKDNYFTVSIKNIIEINSFYNYELEKESTISRAIIGGFIAGGVGSIIGAMTSSEKQKEHKFLYIKYLDDVLEKELLFTGKNHNDMFVSQFIKTYNEYIKKQIEDKSA